MNRINWKYCVLSSFFTAYIWEYMANRFQSKTKPSTTLTSIAKTTHSAFEWIGSIIALINSYLTYVNIADLFGSFRDLCEPICGIFIAPFSMVQGFIDKAKSYGHKEYLIYGGTTASVVGLSVAYRYLYQRFFWMSVSRFFTSAKIKPTIFSDVCQ